MYLLDTNVVSELRKGVRADAVVHTWAEDVTADSIWLSVISVLELEIGVSRMERRDRAQGALLRLWLETDVLARFAERVLPIDTRIAQRCASLHVPDPMPERDALIAATALVHRLKVVTRNTADFDPMGVAVLNPWLGP